MYCKISGPSPGQPPSLYLQELQHRLDWARSLAQENCAAAQVCSKQYYVHTAKDLTFQEGDRVLILGFMASPRSKDSWIGPFPIGRILGPVTYEVK